MKLLWGRLEKWLEINAPDVLDDLNGGASESEILELETALGIKLPEDLKESLRIHNGQTGDSHGLIAGWEFLSTQRILDEWSVWKDLYAKDSFINLDVKAQEGVANIWWQPAWIPLTFNGCGDHHCLDLAPNDEGKNGQIISMWHDSEEREILARSYKQWFEYLVRTFESNDAEYIFENNSFEFSVNQD